MLRQEPWSSEFIAYLMHPEREDGPVLLEELVNRPAWMADAACIGEPPETFFPERGGSLARARELCRGCPVCAECLEHAMADEELAGWWGGTAERERGRLRRAAGWTTGADLCRGP